MVRIGARNRVGVRGRVWLIAVVLLAAALGSVYAAFSATSAHAAQQVDASADRIEALIADLRSPERRDALISQLEILLQAARESEASQTGGSIAATDEPATGASTALDEVKRLEEVVRDASPLGNRGRAHGAVGPRPAGGCGRTGRACRPGLLM